MCVVEGIEPALLAEFGSGGVLVMDRDVRVERRHVVGRVEFDEPPQCRACRHGHDFDG